MKSAIWTEIWTEKEKNLEQRGKKGLQNTGRGYIIRPSTQIIYKKAYAKRHTQGAYKKAYTKRQEARYGEWSKLLPEAQGTLGEGI